MTAHTTWSPRPNSTPLPGSLVPCRPRTCPLLAVYRIHPPHRTSNSHQPSPAHHQRTHWRGESPASSELTPLDAACLFVDLKPPTPASHSYSYSHSRTVRRDRL